MKISIFGLGYVGAVSLACLARDGHTVIGVDVDPAKLDLIRAGKTPVVEEGMIELMRESVASGRVTVTTDPIEAVHASELSFVCVGTPSAANGSQDQSIMIRLAHDLGRAVRSKRDGHLIVFRSTLVPGTVEDVLAPIIAQESGKRDGDGFDACFQPEFLREGSSIRDYDKPPFTVIGANAPAAIEKLRSLFGHLPCAFHATTVRVAEMLKFSCNNFHALKITFANETARLCEALGVDPFAVMDLLCEDRQLNISKAYLKPGFAFGGSCLPKELRATAYLAKSRDVDLPVLGQVLASNRTHVDHVIAKIAATGKRRIGLLGLSFKAGTDDLRESPLVILAEHCIGKGCDLAVHDPEVRLSSLLGANRRFIETQVPHIAALMRDSAADVIAASDVLVLGLNDPNTLAALRRDVRADQTVIDLIGISDRESIRGRYVGACW